MARYKNSHAKQVLAKKGRQTKWAPFWTVPKKYGTGRKVHPGQHTRIKRSWKRVKIRL